MTQKSQEEITAEVEALERVKPNVRRYCKFGDDRHAAIDAQVAVLKGRMSRDDIARIYGDKSATGFEYNVLDEANRAYRWLSGEEYAAPSAEWAGEVRP
jgi:hypothetical protein